MAGLSINTSIFSLIRLPNLLIVGLVQWVVFHYIIKTNYTAAGIPLKLDYLELLILSVVTMCITACGYIINDITDQKTDRINKPDRLIVGRLMTRQTAYWLYLGCNIVGFALAFYLSLMAASVALLSLYPIAQAGLFIYAVRLKNRPLSGNILVALYCAGSVGIVWLAELAGYQELVVKNPKLSSSMTITFIFYLSLAFLTTLFREIIKDMQDEPGDRLSGGQTLPILLGLRKTTLIVNLIGLITITMLVIMYWTLKAYFHPLFSLPVIGIISMSILFVMIRLKNAHKQEEFGRLSTIAKWIIMAGLLLPVLTSF
jgi:4-hydroxybenzoate polyprenyltransferase